jgi:hypothetical protein
MRSKYTRGFVSHVKNDKKTMSLKRISLKYNLTIGQVVYIIYSKKLKERAKETDAKKQYTHPNAHLIEPEPRTWANVMKELFNDIRKFLQ